MFQRDQETQGLQEDFTNMSTSTITKKQLKEAVRTMVRKYLAEQVDFGGDNKTNIEDYVETWIRNNLSLIQEELESSAGLDPNTKPLASDLRDLFMDQMIADAKDMNVVKAMTQQQEQVNSVIDRLLSKTIDREWDTAIEVASELDANYMEDTYGDEMDPYFKRGLSRDDF